MATILIQADSKTAKILAELAKKLGGKVMPISDVIFEDLALGYLMEKAKTDKKVSKDKILKKLLHPDGNAQSSKK